MASFNELVYYPEAGVIDSPFTVALLHMLPKVGEAIRLLNEAGFRVDSFDNSVELVVGHSCKLNYSEE